MNASLRRPRLLGRLLVGLVVVTATACGESGSTELGTPPAALLPISFPVDTVVTGESMDPPISVRVEDALGNAIEGAPVRFIITRGDGTLSPGVAVSAEDGIAESVFRAGASPGENEIRADIPSAPNVSAVQFLVLAEAADSVALSPIEGDAQRAEIASQLARPFVVRALTPSGGPAGGIEVIFRLTDASDDSALLTNGMALTDADGIASSVLTLGRRAGDYGVDVFAGSGVFSDTARFTASASATFDGAIGLDSVGTGGLVAGAQATLFGSGFSPVADQNEVRIEGETAQVLTASGTELTIQVPAFADACLPARDVGVRVLVGSDASNGAMLRLQPSDTPIDLAVGETARFRGLALVECLQFSESATPQEYRVVIGNLSRVASERLSLRVSTRVAADLGGPASASSVVPRPFDAGLRERALQTSRPDLEIRSNAIDGLTSGRVSVARAATGAARRVPVVGDTLEHFFAVGSTLGATCADTTNVVRGVVRSVSDHLVLVEDVAAPSGGLNTAEWAALGTELDQGVVPVDTAYFGGYADIDGNGRVVVLFTPEVNKLGDGNSGVGGFFLPLDLAASGRGGAGVPGPGGETSCPASNEAEILYIITADPDGRVGPTIDKARALRNARGLVAHELQHLISAERRVLQSPAGFAAAEEAWLDEGLSQLAEEVVGLAAVGLSVGGDYTFDQVANTRAELDAFNTYQLTNFLNLSFYMFDPASAPTISPVDPGGVGGLQMRGFGWFLARWLADQAGGDERTLFRSLIGGGQNFVRGIENIERVTSRQWADILSDFGVAVATDDSGVGNLASTFEIATWDFRDVFASLSQNPAARALFPIRFPLQSTRLGFETAALDFDVRASGARYFALASGLDGPALSVSLRRPGGGALNENMEPQITIVRTR